MSYRNQYTTYIDNILYNIDDILYMYILKSQICIYIFKYTYVYYTLHCFSAMKVRENQLN